MVKPMFSVIALAFALLRLCRTVLSFEITLSTAQQCGSLELFWTGSPTVQLSFPLFVRILPFASVPTTFSISKHIWNESTTSGSLSLPITLCGGTQFLLAVIDCSGEGAAPVSDIITVLDSHELSCLCTNASFSPHFTVQTSPDPSLCPLLRVSWDATIKGKHPNIMAFSPGVLPVDLNPSEAAALMDNVVTSTGKFTSESQVVVLLDEKGSPAQTSRLVTVGGKDGADCFLSNSSATAEASSTSSITTETLSDSQRTRLTNKAGVIVGVVIAAVITAAAVILAVLLYRQRRSRYKNGLIPHTRFAASDMTISLRSRSSLSILPPPVPPKSPWALAPNAGVPRSPHFPPPPPPTPPPKSPNVEASRRRSYTIRSPPDTSSSIPINVNDAGSLSYEPRPDSPTLPDRMFLKEPTTPRLAGLTR